MKSASFLTVLVCAAAFFASDSAFAQVKSLRSGRTTMGATTATKAAAGGGAAAAATAEDGKVKIERFPAKAVLAQAPSLEAKGGNLEGPLSGKKREWALYEVKYATSAKWTDELTFIYHVILKGKDDTGKAEFSYYTATVRYQDIPKGQHMSCVCLPPSQVERHGEPVALALEITGKSDVLASESKASGINLPKEWWKDSKIMDDDKIKRRNGLVDRSKTPFALVNPNDYEAVQ